MGSANITPKFLNNPYITRFLSRSNSNFEIFRIVNNHESCINQLSNYMDKNLEKDHKDRRATTYFVIDNIRTQPKCYIGTGKNIHRPLVSFKKFAPSFTNPELIIVVGKEKNVNERFFFQAEAKGMEEEFIKFFKYQNLFVDCLNTPTTTQQLSPEVQKEIERHTIAVRKILIDSGYDHFFMENMQTTSDIHNIQFAGETRNNVDGFVLCQNQTEIQQSLKNILIIENPTEEQKRHLTTAISAYGDKLLTFDNDIPLTNIMDFTILKCIAKIFNYSKKLHKEKESESSRSHNKCQHRTTIFTPLQTWGFNEPLGPNWELYERFYKDELFRYEQLGCNLAIRIFKQNGKMRIVLLTDSTFPNMPFINSGAKVQLSKDEPNTLEDNVRQLRLNKKIYHNTQKDLRRWKNTYYHEGDVIAHGTKWRVTRDILFPNISALLAFATASHGGDLNHVWNIHFNVSLKTMNILSLKNSSDIDFMGKQCISQNISLLGDKEWKMGEYIGYDKIDDIYVPKGTIINNSTTLSFDSPDDYKRPIEKVEKQKIHAIQF